MTPNHITFGNRLVTPPDSETDSEKEETDEGKCMKYIRMRQSHLWNRWERGNLTDLREYHEMRSKENDKPEIGKVMMIKEALTNHGKWKLGGGGYFFN